jgi:hypothetical protein
MPRRQYTVCHDDLDATDAGGRLLYAQRARISTPPGMGSQTVTTYAIYVPQSGLANLRLGLASGVWGWRQSAFETSDSASVIRSMKTNDLVLMAQGGPSPRVPRHRWTRARTARFDVCKVVRGSYRSTSPVWPDDVYPERVGIAVVDSIPPSVDLGREMLEAQRMSANMRGVPVVVSSTTPDWWRNLLDENR